MCTRLWWPADRKASQIESITTSRQLIQNSPPKRQSHCPAPPGTSSRWSPSSVYNCSPENCRSAQVRAFGWGWWGFILWAKGNEVIHEQTDQLWTPLQLAAGAKRTADVGRTQPQHARQDKELSAPPRPPSTDPCHPKALSSSKTAGAKANFPLWLSGDWALSNCSERLAHFAQHHKEVPHPSEGLVNSRLSNGSGAWEGLF